MEMNEVLCLKWNNHKTIFLQNLSSLRTQELYSDATITCNGKFFSVHRLVLSTCSEYFEEIFERISMQSIHPFIIVTNIEAGYLEALLNFMYNGEVNVLHEMLPGLIKAAEILKIKGLAVPDEQTLEKELVYAREREASNTIAVDPPSLQTPSSSSHSPAHINKSINATVPDSSVPTDNSVHSEVNPNDEKDSLSQTNPYSSKEMIEMYPVESSKEYSHNNQGLLLKTDNENNIKVENEHLDNQTESKSSLIPCIEAVQRTPTPSQEISSLVSPHSASYSVYSQDNAHTRGSVHCCTPMPLVDGCERDEPEIDFAVDNTSVKDTSWIENTNTKEETNVTAASVQEVIHGLFLQSESDNNHEHVGLVPHSPHPAKHSKFEEGNSSRVKSKSRKKRSNSSSTPLIPVPKKCPKCSYVTKYVSTLRRHIMFKHTGEKPHQCDFCSYRSAHNFNMKKHMMIHTGEKPFQCPYCTYRAAQNSNIKSHMKSHEKRVIREALRATRKGKT